MKHILSASTMMLIILTAACGGGNKTETDSATKAEDSIISAENMAAQVMADSLAMQDSLAAVDSARFNKVIASNNLNELIEEYNIQCLAVYDEYGSDGMPLGDKPRVLKQALELRSRLVKMENRMNNNQKALYDSLTGYIRRFL